MSQKSSLEKLLKQGNKNRALDLGTVSLQPGAGATEQGYSIPLSHFLPPDTRAKTAALIEGLSQFNSGLSAFGERISKEIYQEEKTRSEEQLVNLMDQYHSMDSSGNVTDVKEINYGERVADQQNITDPLERSMVVDAVNEDAATRLGYVEKRKGAIRFMEENGLDPMKLPRLQRLFDKLEAEKYALIASQRVNRDHALLVAPNSPITVQSLIVESMQEEMGDDSLTWSSLMSMSPHMGDAFNKLLMRKEDALDPQRSAANQTALKTKTLRLAQDNFAFGLAALGDEDPIEAAKAEGYFDKAFKVISQAVADEGLGYADELVRDLETSFEKFINGTEGITDADIDTGYKGWLQALERYRGKGKEERDLSPTAEIRGDTPQGAAVLSTPPVFENPDIDVNTALKHQTDTKEAAAAGNNPPPTLVTPASITGRHMLALQKNARKRPQFLKDIDGIAQRMLEGAKIFPGDQDLSLPARQRGGAGGLATPPSQQTVTLEKYLRTKFPSESALLELMRGDDYDEQVAGLTDILFDHMAENFPKINSYSNSGKAEAYGALRLRVEAAIQEMTKASGEIAQRQRELKGITEVENADDHRDDIIGKYEELMPLHDYDIEKVESIINGKSEFDIDKKDSNGDFVLGVTSAHRKAVTDYIDSWKGTTPTLLRITAGASAAITGSPEFQKIPTKGEKPKTTGLTPFSTSGESFEAYGDAAAMLQTSVRNYHNGITERVMNNAGYRKRLRLAIGEKAKDKVIAEIEIELEALWEAERARLHGLGREANELSNSVETAAEKAAITDSLGEYKAQSEQLTKTRKEMDNISTVPWNHDDMVNFSGITRTGVMPIRMNKDGYSYLAASKEGMFRTAMMKKHSAAAPLLELRNALGDAIRDGDFSKVNARLREEGITVSDDDSRFLINSRKNVLTINDAQRMFEHLSKKFSVSPNVWKVTEVGEFMHKGVKVVGATGISLSNAYLKSNLTGTNAAFFNGNEEVQAFNNEPGNENGKLWTDLYNSLKTANKLGTINGEVISEEQFILHQTKMSIDAGRASAPLETFRDEIMDVQRLSEAAVGDPVIDRMLQHQRGAVKRDDMKVADRGPASVRERDKGWWRTEKVIETPIEKQQRLEAEEAARKSEEEAVSDLILLAQP